MRIYINPFAYDKRGENMVEEDYFFSTTTEEISHQKKAYVLIIYDIVGNAKRVRMAKFLQVMVSGYRNRHLRQ